MNKYEKYFKKLTISLEYSHEISIHTSQRKMLHGESLKLLAGEIDKSDLLKIEHSQDEYKNRITTQAILISQDNYETIMAQLNCVVQQEKIQSLDFVKDQMLCTIQTLTARLNELEKEVKG